MQSHFRITALTYEITKGRRKQIPLLRYQALKDLDIICDITKDECVKRAQYEA